MSLFGLFGPPNIERLIAKQDIRGLIAASNYPKDPGVRLAALNGLMQIGSAAAFEPLVGALKDTDPLVRKAAVVALADYGNMRPVEPLIQALGDEDINVRGSALQSLGKIGAIQALDRMRVLLKDPNADVRRAAADAIVAIGLPSDPTIQTWCAAAQQNWTRVASFGDQAVEPLSAVYGLSSQEQCHAIIETLAQIGPVAVESLIAVFRNSLDSGAHEMSARALGRIRDSRAIEPLVDDLGSVNDDVQQTPLFVLANTLEFRKGELTEPPSATIEALMHIGEEAVEPLVPILLGSKNWSARKNAARALGRIGGTRATEALCTTVTELFEARRADAYVKAVREMQRLSRGTDIDLVVAMFSASDDGADWTLFYHNLTLVRVFHKSSEHHPEL